MGSMVKSTIAFLLTSLLALLFGVSSVLSQDLRERDGLCNADGCFVVYFQRKTFLDSWRACKVKGGDLATIKRKEDATIIDSLFTSLDLRDSRTKVQVWIGLQRQPRQCDTNDPLRGFSWTTGDQDTVYTNWQKEDSPGMCSVPRCVVMSYSNQEQIDNFKWLDGSCSAAVDGYLCHYAYNGMCSAVANEGAGDVLYNTPFDLLSTLLTHVPFGSVATMPCPGSKAKQSVSCMLKEDGSVGWSRDFPLCTDPPLTHNRCGPDNGGCEHFCRSAGVQSYCECDDRYQLGANGKSCELSDVCRGDPCEFECLRLSDSYRCACPEGYMLAPDEHGCLDVDECLQSPCEQLCVNSAGTFECQCREGYNPDDEGACEDIDECINEPCEHACENTQGSHICHCHLGYSPLPDDASQCQDTDECQIPGTCEQMCVNYEGGFECYCEEGYELMSDHYSCHKRGEGDYQSAVTPPFPGITHRPGPDWGWDWDQQSHTDWPLEEEKSIDWLTDPPRVLDSDVIWVTSAPEEQLPFDLALDPLTPETEDDEKDIDNRGAYWMEMGQRSQSELEVLPTAISTTSPPFTSSSTDTDWYEDDEEETTTAPTFLSTTTISEGAFNWWVGLTTPGKRSGNPWDSVTDHNMDSSKQNEAEEQYPLGESSLFPEKELGEEESDHVEVTLPQDVALPTHPTAFQSPPSKGKESGDTLDTVPGDRGQTQGNTWLLVGLLVPTCIFIVVMVALGIIYCTRCVVPRNKNSTDCYHWISGAHDKQGAPNPSPGVKTHV